MSIDDEIRLRVKEGRLFRYEPRDSLSVVRPVFISQSVHSEIYKPHPDFLNEIEGARALLEKFMFGKEVSATLKRSPNTDLKRLQDGLKPIVWEMRVCRPCQARLFGCFAKSDVFIATELAGRDGLNFDENIADAKTRWNALFPSNRPIISDSVNGYISGKARKL